MLVYGTYTQRNIPYIAFNGIHLNGNYDLSFFLSYQEYQLSGLRSVKDGGMIIGDDKYLTPTRIFIADYDENVLSQAQIDAFIASIPSEFNIKTFSTPNECTAWIKLNTSLVEQSTGVFQVYPSYTDMITGVIVPEKILTIV